MTLEFLSGLLLVLIVLGTLGYMAKELLADLRPRQAKENPSSPRPTQRRRESKPVNEHLIGTTGEVVANSDDDERPMRVRLGSELWPARSGAAGDSPLPVGTPIEVTAVQGPILVVRPSEPAIS